MEASERYPSKPEAFGYKLTWLAIKDADPFELLHELNYQQWPVYSANWQGGLDKVYHYNATFICPAIDGWTFVISPAIRDLSDENTLVFLRQLSIKFTDVQCYSNHRVASYAAWGRFLDGRPIRLFSTADGVTSINEGPLTRTEIRLIAERNKAIKENKWDYSTEKANSDSLNDVDEVMEMAGQWSINPQTLDEQPETFELGLLIIPH